MTDHSARFPYARVLIALGLLWLSGVAMRLTLLAVPPALPSIHDDLHLSATEVGILTGLPSMLFALAAVPGSLLIARLGAVPAVVTGLLLCAVGGALRGAVSDVMFLYAMTVAMGAGIAVMQVSMPPLVRLWMPKRIGFATAVYTNGLLVGEIAPVALMIPLVLPLAGGSWQWAFAIWSVPVLLIALLVVALARREAPADPATASARRRWWPDWNDSLIWKLGVLMGTANAMYFGVNAFLPDYLTRTGQQDWISAALTALNVGQLPASFLLLAFAARLERAVWPYVACAIGCIAAITGMLVTTGPWVVACAAFLGFFIAGIFILALTLPPLLSAPDDVHRVSAAMFTISYSCAVVVPIISGAVWDLTGVPFSAFVPLGLMGVLLIVLAPSINHVKMRP